METKLIKKLLFVGIIIVSTIFIATAQRKEKLLSTDILLNGKPICRNYPKGDNSYKSWDKGAVLISSYTDEEFGTLYEDKMKDSILFRKGTNTKYNYTEFWWFELLSSKHSIHIQSKNVYIRIGNNIENFKNIFPKLWNDYETIIKKDEKNKQKEVQLHIPLLFYFEEKSKELSEGSFQIYVKNESITRITINFMLEGDMP
jgi:hypothetical protein